MKVVFKKILSFLASTSNRLKLNVFLGFFTRHAKTLGLSLLLIQFGLFLSALVTINDQVDRLRWDLMQKIRDQSTCDSYAIMSDISDAEARIRKKLDGIQKDIENLSNKVK